MLVALAALAACVGAPAASAQQTVGQAAARLSAAPFPALTGRVVDGANVLETADEARLTARLADLETRTKHQFVIVTVASLGGRDIESYARDLGNSWGIGRKGVNDGVLLVIAPNERFMRIAVGKGLSAVLSDARSEEIVQTLVLPEFRKGNMAQGIKKGADAIIAALSENK